MNGNIVPEFQQQHFQIDDLKDFQILSFFSLPNNKSDQSVTNKFTH